MNPGEGSLCFCLCLASETECYVTGVVVRNMYSIEDTS